MRLVFRTLGNPLAQHRDLAFREMQIRFAVRHHVVWISALNAADNLALVRLAGDDGNCFRLRGLEGLFADIEPEFRFACRRIGAVAFETLARKNGPHIAIVFELWRACVASAGRFSGEERGEQRAQEWNSCVHGRKTVLPATTVRTGLIRRMSSSGHSK